MKPLKNFNGIVLILAFVFCLLLVTGCTNKEVVADCLKGHTFGFWGGLWHGIIAPVDLIISLWKNDVTVYAQNNNGAWYAFGFIIGSGGWGFLGGHRASRKRKN